MATGETDYAGATWHPSPNFGYTQTGQHGRPCPITAIVMHGTAGGGAVSWFSQARSQVSAHYVVDTEGSVTQCVREDDVAWHAGEVTANSAYYGQAPNTFTIGIEHVRNQANDSPLTPAQQAASIALITDIRRRRGALPLVPHDAIDVGRICPGPEFPLAAIDAAARPKGAPPVWTPIAQHVSQLFHRPTDPAGAWGDNDCFPASLTRYLLESRAPWAGTPDALISALRQAITGQPDVHSNPYTYLAQINAFWPYIGLGPTWALAANRPAIATTPWALLLVSAIRLQPRQYPDAWLAGVADEPNHFILRLPNGMVNDPLAANNEDVTYSDAELAHALDVPGAGAYLMPDPATLTWQMVGADMVARVVPPQPAHVPAQPPVVTPAPIKPRFRLASAQWLQVTPKPNNAVPGAPQVPKGAAIVCIGNPVTVTDAKGGKSRWQKIMWADKGKPFEGFVLSRVVKAI